MNVTQLIKRVRRSAFVEDTAVDWTDANIVEELNDTQTQLYARAVVNGDQGSWQMTEYVALVGGQRSYRMPARSVMGTVIRSQVCATSDPSNWWHLDELTEADAWRYENSVPGDEPQRKIIRGENIYVLPPVAASGYVMRTHYAIRPSRLCLPQTAPTTAGLINAINPSTRALSITSPIQSIAEDGVNGGNILVGTRLVDVIRVAGWHKVQWTGTATFSNSGNTVTLATNASGLDEANDLSTIAVGDVVRVAEQTDWPAIPADYHRSLADATAAKILTARGMTAASQALAQMHVTPDLQRFGDLVRLRDESSAYVFVAPEFCG